MTVASRPNVRLAVARVERQHALIEQLRCAAPKRVPAGSLALVAGVSTRTVERDVAALREAGVPISFRTGPAGGYTLATRSALPPLSLSPAEAAALVVSLVNLGPYSSASAQTALRKLLVALVGPGQDTGAAYRPSAEEPVMASQATDRPNTATPKQTRTRP